MERRFDRANPKNGPIILRFNPWIVGTRESLIQSFLVQLAARIGSTDHVRNGKQAARQLLSYSTVFTALKFIPGAEPWASIVHGVINSVGRAAKEIAELKELDLDQRKRAVISALQDIRRPIIVLIDDLDRLSSPEVFEMIRLVKAVGDFPSVSYVLCYDPKYLVAALEHHGLDNPGEYLDKIVQLRITLPPISREDLLGILNLEYDALPKEAIASFQNTGERAGELYFEALKFLLETPRDIKRVFNRVRLSEPGCRDEINLADLIGLETLAIKAPTVYEHIRTNPDAYVGTPNEDMNVYAIFSRDETRKDTDTSRENAVSDLPDHLKRHVQALLAALFPLCSRNHESHSEGEYRAEGRIATRDRLQVALTSGVPTGEFPLLLGKQFVLKPESRSRIVDKALQERKIRRFLDQVWDVARSAAPVDPKSFCTSITHVVDRPEARDDVRARQDGIQGSATRQAWEMVQDVLHQLPSDARWELIRTVVGDQDGYSVGALLMIHLHRQHGFFDPAKAVPENEQWVDNAKLMQLMSEWILSVDATTKSGTLFYSMELRMVLRFIGQADQKLATRIGQALLKETIVSSMQRCYPWHMQALIQSTDGTRISQENSFNHSGILVSSRAKLSSAYRIRLFRSRFVIVLRRWRPERKSI